MTKLYTPLGMSPLMVKLQVWHVTVGPTVYADDPGLVLSRYITVKLAGALVADVHCRNAPSDPTGFTEKSFTPTV